MTSLYNHKLNKEMVSKFVLMKGFLKIKLPE